MSLVSLPGFRTAAAVLLGATLLAGVLEWRSSDGGHEPVRVSASARPAQVLPAQQAALAPATAVADPDAALRSGSMAAIPVPAAAAQAAAGDPAAMFAAAVKAVREAPQTPPPAGVAQARSFPEAFEAMREAQRQPPAASAGLNPFAAAAK